MMKKFTVKPRLASASQIVGVPNGASSAWVYLGRLAEAGPLAPIRYDLAHAHVVAIFGKRGSGKSYTLGSFLEGLCTGQAETSIGCNPRQWGVLLFDTLGIFQWADIPIQENAAQEVIRQQFAVRRGWDIKSEALDVQVCIPQGTRTESTPAGHHEFAIRSSDFSAADWGYLLGLDIYQDRMGQLLNDAYVKVTVEGWQDGTRRHPPVEAYSLDHLLACIKLDTELQASYQTETRRAVLQQLMTFRRNPLFQDEGTALAEFLQPGRLSVVVMNRMSDELRLVVISALIRRIIAARIEASEQEKHLRIRPDLTADERERIQAQLKSSIPPSWVVIDEAQNALPAERRTTATDMLVKFVREGRNYGLSFMVATQQPTALDQRILSQVDTLIAHRLTVQGDIDYVRRNLKSNLPAEVVFANSRLSFDELMRSLDVGQALVSNTEAERSFILDIRPRVSVHGGF
jgi:DNA helicase HerA-like ATPase